MKSHGLARLGAAGRGQAGQGKAGTLQRDSAISEKCSGLMWPPISYFTPAEGVAAGIAKERMAIESLCRSLHEPDGRVYALRTLELIGSNAAERTRREKSERK